MAQSTKRMILMSGGREASPTPALLSAVEAVGATVLTDQGGALPDGVGIGDGGGGPVLAVLCEISKGVSTDELRQKVAHATSKWSGVPVIAYHPYEYQERDVATQNGHRTNALLLKYLGFQAVIEDPSQLPIALREAAAEQQQQQQQSAARDSAAGARPPADNDLSEALLGLARCAHKLSSKSLRTAFEIVAALHLAGERKQAAQLALAGFQRLIEADHWVIYAVSEATDAPDDLDLLVAVHANAAYGDTAADWRNNTATAAAREAVKKAAVVRTKDNARQVLAVPLVCGERIYGVIEATRRTQVTSAFQKEDVQLLAALAGPLACALTNAERMTKAEQLSITDDLTKLHNARYLRQFLSNEIKRARRYNSPVAIIFLDLDNFKKVNDVHGHLAGSHVLKELAAVVLRSVRDTDVVARYGGDEFVVVLPQSKAEQAVFVAERMREKIAKWIFTGGRGLQLRVTASFGVTAFPQNALSPQELLDSADAAMYEAKAHAKNCVRLASEFSAQNFDENVFSQ